MAIRRTFRRKAIDGLVKADGRLWRVSQDGNPYTGKVVLRINVACPDAHYEVDCTAVFLNLELVKRLHETGV